MKLSLPALALIALTLFSTAQTPRHEFVNGLARFAIEVEGEPALSPVELEFSGYELGGRSFAWETDDQLIEVQEYTVFSDRPKLTAIDKKKIVQGLADNFSSDMKTVDARIARAPFIDGTISGIELKITTSYKLVTRVFFAGTRAYLVSMSIDDSFEASTRAMKRFRLLGHDEYIAALIADTTPESLPQLSGDASGRSEAKSVDLRGRVRSVITETKPARGLRARTAEASYNDRGMLLKEVSYDAGYPSVISVFGWIDGKRVSSSAPVDYGPNEGPERREIIAMMMEAPPGMPTIAPVEKRDDRYSFRYERGYDSTGALTETKIFDNLDDLNWRSEFVHKSGQRERSDYDFDNKLDKKTIETLDTKGNVIEESHYDNKGRLEKTASYTYEFDSVGNWIVRKEFTKVRGRQSAAPVSITYRQITYY